MKVDHVLILAAGKGTRMGEIGKTMPKVIWPIFEKSIIELEVEYAKRLAPNAQVHINLYNYKEKVLEHISKKKDSFKNVNILIEDGVLDIGGAIHNLAQNLDYNGNLLILNSDQFLFCDPSIISESVTELTDFDSLLFSYEVDPKDGYNALAIEGGVFKGVTPNKEILQEESVVTYTGMSLINLNKLEATTGESKFFDTVANPKQYKVKVSKLSDFEYWDFGTLDRYAGSIWRIFEQADSKFVEFLKFSDALVVDNLRLVDEKSAMIVGSLNVYKNGHVFKGSD